MGIQPQVWQIPYTTLAGAGSLAQLRANDGKEKIQMHFKPLRGKMPLAKDI